MNKRFFYFLGCFLITLFALVSGARPVAAQTQTVTFYATDPGDCSNPTAPPLAGACFHEYQYVGVSESDFFEIWACTTAETEFSVLAEGEVLSCNYAGAVAVKFYAGGEGYQPSWGLSEQGCGTVNDGTANLLWESHLGGVRKHRFTVGSKAGNWCGGNDYAWIDVTVCQSGFSPPSPPPDYCPDGIELLTEPVTLTLSASWQSTNTTTTYDYLAVRYRMENQSPGSANIYGVATVNGDGYSVNGGNVAVYTTTVPGGLTGLAGPDVEAAFKNTGDPVTLASACVINRPPPRPRYCTYFYDFEDDLEGWQFAPGVGGNHDPDESNGAARILGDGALDAVMLSPLFESGLWEMSAGVRSYGDDVTVTLGLIGATWPYTDTYKSFIVGSDYETIQAMATISGYAQIASQHTYVDWVCLNNVNAGIPIGGILYPFLPIPDCGGRPTFDDHPDFSITEIGNWIHWLASKLGEVLAWLVCILTGLINTAINWLLTQLVRLIELLPQVPENLFDLTGWIEWYRQLFILAIAWVVRQIVNFYTSISNIIDWIVSEIVVPVVEWFRDLFVEIAAWIIGHVLAVISVVTGIDLLQIWSDARIFMQALGDELSLEFNSFLLLFGSLYDVLAVMITGWRGSLAGDATADFGQGLGGFAAYLWVGVDWVNDAIEGTPLTALNFVAMGIIAWGLVQFTLGRVRSWMEKIARL